MLSLQHFSAVSFFVFFIDAKLPPKAVTEQATQYNNAIVARLRRIRRRINRQGRMWRSSDSNLERLQMYHGLDPG